MSELPAITTGSQDAINDIHRSTDLQVSIWYNFTCRCGMRLANCHDLLEHNTYFHPHDSSHWHGAVRLPATSSLLLSMSATELEHASISSWTTASITATSSSVSDDGITFQPTSTGVDQTWLPSHPSPSPTSSPSLSPTSSTFTSGTSSPCSSALSTPKSEFRVYTPFSSDSDPGAPTYGYDLGAEIAFEDRVAYAWAGGAKALGLPQMAGVLQVDEEEIAAQMGLGRIMGYRSAEEERMRWLAPPPPPPTLTRTVRSPESRDAREAARKAKKAASSKARRQIQSAQRKAAKLDALAAKKPKIFTCQWRGLGCPKSYKDHSGIKYHSKPEKCAFAPLAFPSTSTPVLIYTTPKPAPSTPSLSSSSSLPPTHQHQLQELFKVEN